MCASLWRLALILTLLPGGALADGARTGYWPTAGWRSSTPEAQGMDGAKLAALDAEFASGKHGYIDGVLIIRHGFVVYEKSYQHDYGRLFEGKGPRGLYNYYDPDWHPYYKNTDLHTLQSVSKSVTSALVGMAIGRGQLPGVDAEARRYLQGFRLHGDPRQARITLRHLLTMTAGIRWDEATVSYTDPRNACAAMEASEDWIQFVLDQPMAEEPGKVFVYNSGATELLAQVLKKATGKQADDYAAEHLFKPLGIRRFYWKRTPKGLPDTEGGLYLTPRDLAKIGYLYLHDGVWQDKRLLPAGWVRDSQKPHVETTRADNGQLRRLRYGYKWWVLPDESGTRFPAYSALGYGGQRLIVIPELDVVAVFTGWNIYDKPSLPVLFALDRVAAAVKP